MSDTKEYLWYLFIQSLLNRQNKTVIVKNVCFSYKSVKKKSKEMVTVKLKILGGCNYQEEARGFWVLTMS